MAEKREEAQGVAEVGETSETKPSEKKKSSEAPSANSKEFLKNKENAKKLKAVAEDYGFIVSLDGSDVKHNIPSNQLPALIALVK